MEFSPQVDLRQSVAATRGKAAPPGEGFPIFFLWCGLWCGLCGTCLPPYYPDPGVCSFQHSASGKTKFYVVTSGHVKSIFTSHYRSDTMTKRYSGARQKSVATWGEAVDIWTTHCLISHQHRGGCSLPNPLTMLWGAKRFHRTFTSRYEAQDTICAFGLGTVDNQLSFAIWGCAVTCTVTGTVILPLLWFMLRPPQVFLFWFCVAFSQFVIVAWLLTQMKTGTTTNCAFAAPTIVEAKSGKGGTDSSMQANGFIEILS
ncbi:hypothetical protein DFH06DRAFT_1143461 [Mycena polygramma]|nr:hypothetical protein DFH06DRAFT_1143461 [Mycena polygramma]